MAIRMALDLGLHEVRVFTPFLTTTDKPIS